LRENRARTPACTSSNSSSSCSPSARTSRPDTRRMYYVQGRARTHIHVYVCINRRAVKGGGENRRWRRRVREGTEAFAQDEAVKMEIRSRPRGLSFCRTRMRNGCMCSYRLRSRRALSYVRISNVHVEPQPFIFSWIESNFLAYKYDFAHYTIFSTSSAVSKSTWFLRRRTRERNGIGGKKK
jgi:hypothetical protein